MPRNGDARTRPAGVRRPGLGHTSCSLDLVTRFAVFLFPPPPSLCLPLPPPSWWEGLAPLSAIAPTQHGGWGSAPCCPVCGLKTSPVEHKHPCLTSSPGVLCVCACVRVRARVRVCVCSAPRPRVPMPLQGREEPPRGPWGEVRSPSPVSWSPCRASGNVPTRRKWLSSHRLPRLGPGTSRTAPPSVHPDGRQVHALRVSPLLPCVA